MAKKNSFINRLIVGKEKSEGYAISKLPSNRWELFWDVFKGSFWKLVLINLLMLLFFLPVLALFIYRNMVISGMGSLYPFSTVFGVGYQAPASLVGFSESIVLNANLTVLLFLPLLSLIFSVGISGGAYVIRNMVWTEGIFVANDFWKGVKQNFIQIAVIVLIYSVVFYLSICGNAMIKQLQALGTLSGFWGTFLSVLTYVFLVLYSIVTLHMITMCTTYELTLIQLYKNALLFTFGLLFHNAVILLLVSLPFILIGLGGLLGVIFGGACIFVGGSFALLGWTDFCQWGYDRYINAKIGAKRNRGIYEKDKKDSESETLKKYRAQIASSASGYGNRPIKPITDDELQIAELPENFNRSDIEKLNQSKQEIYHDNEEYIKLHQKEFEPSEDEKAEIEKQKQEREKRIEAAKRELAKRRKK